MVDEAAELPGEGAEPEIGREGGRGEGEMKGMVRQRAMTIQV